MMRAVIWESAVRMVLEPIADTHPDTQANRHARKFYEISYLVITKPSISRAQQSVILMLVVRIQKPT